MPTSQCKTTPTYSEQTIHCHQPKYHHHVDPSPYPRDPDLGRHTWGITRPEQKEAIGKIIAAQLALPTLPEFKGAAATTETRDFYRPQDPFGGNKQTIHWHGNGESYWLVGEAMGRDMVKLLDKGN